MSAVTGLRIFITGAAGYIGSRLAYHLHMEGARVVGLEHTPGTGAELAEVGIDMVRGDITDAGQMAAILSTGFDVVMHIAAWLGGPDPRRAQPVNTLATRQLAQLSAEAGVQRFVFTSSIAVYGFLGDDTGTEDRPLTVFGDPYGDSKILAEQALHDVAEQTGLDVVIVRPGMVYGPGSRGWAVRPARWAKRGITPLLDRGQGTAYPIYVDDLVELLALAAVHPAAGGKTFNAVHPDPVTLGDFLGGYMQMLPTQRALRLSCWLARSAATLVDPFVRRYRVAYLVSMMCGRGIIPADQAIHLLGWQLAVRLDEGLRRTEAWLHEEGIL